MLIGRKNLNLKVMSFSIISQIIRSVKIRYLFQKDARYENVGDNCCKSQAHPEWKKVHSTTIQENSKVIFESKKSSKIGSQDPRKNASNQKIFRQMFMEVLSINDIRV